MSRRSRLLAVGALGAAVAAGVTVARRRAAALIEPVAEDLRTPLLLATPSFRTGRLLPLLRSAPAPKVMSGRRVSVRSEQIPDGATGRTVRTLVYERPDRRDQPSGAVLWIHGGGYVIGMPEQDARFCRRWAEDLGLLVVAPSYRLAPGHPFPASLDDCYATLCWLHDNAEELGVDPDRIAVAGDSAGGGLAAALAQVSRDRAGPPLRAQVLLEPMLDDRTVLREDHAGRGRFVWTPTSNRFGWTSYLGRPPVADEAPAYAVPARTADLTGLPPTWIGVGSLDLFHDEDVAYAERLRAAGVPCQLDVAPGMFHGATAIFSKAPTARGLFDAMTDALASGVGIDGPDNSV